MVLVALLANPSLAGWISEIQPNPRHETNIARQITVTIPPLVELSGLDGLSRVDLVILDASTSQTRHGRIKQVIPIGSGPGVRVVTDGPWPFPDFVNTSDNHRNAAITVLDQDNHLELGGPKSVLLFDGPTGLVSNSGHINAFLDQITAQLIDVVTYGPAGQTRPFDQEQILTANSGDVITRPMMKEVDPSQTIYYIGSPTMSGTLVVDNSPTFPLNPGLMNLAGSSLQIPEPHTAVLIVLAVCLRCLALPRRRHAGLTH